MPSFLFSMSFGSFVLRHKKDEEEEEEEKKVVVNQ